MLIPELRPGLALLLFAIFAPLPAIELQGRLPGEQFREDNPPRYGAVMSFVSAADSVVMLHAKDAAANFAIADQLKRIAKGFKVPATALEKLGLVEGNTRWLQYSFRKQRGGGYIYITRKDQWIVYLVIFNLRYETLSIDLPYIDRYIRQLVIAADPE